MGKRKAFCLIIWWLVLALLDGLLTYLGTPDLSLEGNPLVAYFGLGWSALFIANAVTFAAYSLVIYYAFAVYERKTLPVTNWQEYVSLLLYNRPDRFRWVFYRLRTNWRPTMAVFGYAFGYASLLGRLILVFEWLTYLIGISLPWYQAIRRAIPYQRLDIALGVFATLALMIHWFYREYNANLERLAQKQAVNDEIG